MRTIPFVGWIANAAARWVGPRGAVTEKAQATGCSRQCVYDHAQKVLAAVQAEHNGGPTREELIQQNEALRRENAQLWDWLSQTIEFPLAKQQEFAVTALAMGLSLNQTLVLLAILLGAAAAPSRSRMHRWVQAAAKAAGAVLKRLDQAAKTLVVVGCLDEIFFHRRPVLVGVEPTSMVWFLGTKAENCQGSTWSAALQPWTALEYVVSDAGSGLQAGIAQMQQHRRQNQQVPLDSGLDVFHTKREAQRVLKILWSQVEGLWEQAEAASRAVAAAQQQGRDARGSARHASATWKEVEGAFQRYEQAEAAWKRAELALNLFRPDGQLNDRSWAKAQIAAALPGLSGAVWSKVRGFLEASAALTFLDRVHDQLVQLGLSEELRAALVRLWWLRRQQPRSTNPQTLGGYRAVAPLVQQLLCQQLDPNWRASYRQVAAVLRRTARASSAVECMNSVLRMHQSRHRTLTQELLDLKRLYWNTRVFRGGKRKARCPYEHLGLALPRYDFWGLLREEMSTAVGQANEPAIAA
jgi:tetratricopeptide (TPR) repeat protein